jgi:hypothetical protein
MQLSIQQFMEGGRCSLACFVGTKLAFVFVVEDYLALGTFMAPLS